MIQKEAPEQINPDLGNPLVFLQTHGRCVRCSEALVVLIYLNTVVPIGTVVWNSCINRCGYGPELELEG